MDNILPSYLILGAILFCIGLYGALSKKSAVIVLLSIELMLNACNLNFIASLSIAVYRMQRADRAG